jgi:hypothetical protein
MLHAHASRERLWHADKKLGRGLVRTEMTALEMEAPVKASAADRSSATT